MENNISPRLQRLFEFAEVKTLRGLLGAIDRSQEVLDEVIKRYRRQLSLCGYLFICVQLKQQACFFSADNPIWDSSGFGDLVTKEFQLLELLLEKFGHPMTISKDGILCSISIERIHPLGDIRAMEVS